MSRSSGGRWGMRSPLLVNDTFHVLTDGLYRVQPERQQEYVAATVCNWITRLRTAGYRKE
ncbi:hypothetical protein [Dickeya dianthicola]|uniref:hypothetical protein n=1 Tax=Dickeya dianthicola TaxID=204039 RepID=UPI001865F520|nr:hypothetical protein [Dickeya dianthicola]QOL14095.1 hypothetical protein HGI48_07625 [Dickeya dianthicola]